MYKLFLIFSFLIGLLTSAIVNAQTCNNLAIEESTPTNAFTFSSDGKTVTHVASGLTWKRCLETQVFHNNETPDNPLDDECDSSTPNPTIMPSLSWFDALNQAQIANNENYGGYSDWRVPNLKELYGIVEHCQRSFAINRRVFPGDPFSWVWSSSPAVNDLYDSSSAWGVHFYNGWVGTRGRDSTGSVRLVRGG